MESVIHSWNPRLSCQSTTEMSRMSNSCTFFHSYGLTNGWLANEAWLTQTTIYLGVWLAGNCCCPMIAAQASPPRLPPATDVPRQELLNYMDLPKQYSSWQLCLEDKVTALIELYLINTYLNSKNNHLHPGQARDEWKWRISGLLRTQFCTQSSHWFFFCLHNCVKYTKRPRLEKFAEPDIN